MTTYILLRNNKESAPCTIDDIKNLGLKTDDLVWVEGQSVCWLGPVQIPELKNLVGLPPEKPEILQNEPVSSYEQKWAGYAQTTTVEEIPETKYSKPVDETREVYLKNSGKNSYSFQIPPQFRKAGLYAGLVLLGVIAGVLIKRSGAQKEPVLSAAETKAVPNEIPSSSTTATDPSTINISEETASQTQIDQQQQELSLTNAKEIKKPETKTSELQLNQPVTMSEIISSPVTEPVTVIEEKKEEEKPVKKISLNEVRSQVSVRTNDYSVGSFGGIKNLKLTITNHSKYELDKVAVEIEYLKPMNEFLRSETVSVQALGPGETKVIEIKKSSRGVKVNCKVSSIRSKDFSDDTAGL